jgi:hypothetical protein
MRRLRAKLEHTYRVEGEKLNVTQGSSEIAVSMFVFLFHIS